MWLSKTGAVVAGAGAGLANIGSGAVRFLRAGYPPDIPKGGFVAAIALLPRKNADGDET
jgi:hypothetical protein